jgi:K+-sensing histidine kinase KdpD
MLTQLFTQLQNIVGHISPTHSDARKCMREMVIHDLRAPLTTMGLRLDLMMEEHQAALPGHMVRDLQMLGAEVQRLQRLSNTLLEVERIAAGKMLLSQQSIECKPLITKALESVNLQGRWKNVRFEVCVPDQLQCFADDDRTTQVLINLLSNAVKFAPKGSTVTILARTAGDNVRFGIMDAGKGVAEQKTGLLFSKFAQIDPNDKASLEGCGLGLYICKTLVTAQGGSIGYTPLSPKGSCFWFELPARRPTNA